MSFGAGVATKAFMWLVVYILLQDQIVSEEWPVKCIEEECGGIKKLLAARRAGEYLCSGGGNDEPAVACKMKCLGKTPDEDQALCFKAHCALYPEGFCFINRHKQRSIRASECDIYLDEGRVKYYGWQCPELFKRKMDERRNQTANN